MNPTLRESDLLEIMSYGDQAIKTGDVILFLPPQQTQPVVHRVISVISQGLRTRGDNNSDNDIYLLHPTNIAGRVVAAWRGQKRCKIPGGRIGWIMFLFIRCQRTLKHHFVFPLLRPIYHFLNRWGIMHRLLPDRFSPRVVLFQANGSRYPCLLLGRRVVGQYDTEQGQWCIRHPFRLFVNEHTLPEL